jgi:hypothetical protein
MELRSDILETIIVNHSNTSVLFNALLFHFQKNGFFKSISKIVYEIYISGYCLVIMRQAVKNVVLI